MIAGVRTVKAATALALRGEVPAEGLTAGVLTLLRLNKVPLAALESSPMEKVREAWSRMAGRPEARAALGEERHLTVELLDGWREVASAFDCQGIPWALFKSPRWFPALSSNLDVLVPAARFAEAARILRELGHIRFPHYREDHKLLYRTFREGRASLSVHLHQMVSWGKVLILEGAAVVTRASVGTDGFTRVSAPPDALVVTVAHTVFETDQIRLGDLLIVKEVLAAGAAPSSLLEEARRGSWLVAAAAGLSLYDFTDRETGGEGILSGEETKRVAGILGENPWAGRRVGGITRLGIDSLPLVLPRIFSKEHLIRYLVADPGRSPDRKVADLVSSGWNLVANRFRLRTRPASLITVGGVDGSGKSVTADSVAAALELCEVPVARIWTRGGFSRLAAAGKAAARRAAPGAVPAASDEDGKRDFLRSGWRRRLWIWATVLEQALGVQRVRILLALGRTVVADRYVGDTLADMASRLPEGPGGAAEVTDLLRPASLLLGAAPAPHLSVLITLPAETAFGRKPDGGTLQARERLVRAYRVMEAGSGPTRLDGTRLRQEVAQESVDLALRVAFSRFDGGTE